MSDHLIRAIPTKYRGITFRSRLEAKWAAMFDQLEWRWEYEAIDLNGYIPDFILQFHQPVLAEVKPAMTFNGCRQYTAEIALSGWIGDALIFGGALKLGPNSFLGPECCFYGQRISELRTLAWAPGEMHKCLRCGAYSIYHTEQSYRCIVGGCYDGGQLLGPVNFDTVHEFWTHATDACRFEPEGGMSCHI